MHPMIEACNLSFGKPIRQFTRAELSYLKIKKPLIWRFLGADDLNVIFKSWQDVFSKGKIVWGHIVQANMMLFEDGSLDAPATVVYSAQDDHVHPNYLQQVAHSIFELKETTQTDPELARAADEITDELKRVFGSPVPTQLSPSVRCQTSVVFIVRKHLPERRLNCPLFPLVVYPGRPQMVAILPCRYWPINFTEWWVNQ